MAGWNGAPLTYVRNCFTVRTALVSAAGAATQPIFQPVTLKDLPALPTMTVRSRMPGQSRDRDVPAAIEDKVLVDLVCDDDEVVPRWRARAITESSSRCKYLAGGVMRRVEQDRPGPARDRGA